MEEKVGPQIILLPASNYWEWVNSARDYALAYDVSITAVPQNAAQFHYPTQVITVISPAGISEGQDSPLRWLQREVPSVRIDEVRAETPEQLAALLRERIRSGARYGERLSSPSRPSVTMALRLLWPTDYPEINQGFGENAALYRRWGLPGHEGVDFRTTFNGRVYACANGEVYLAHDGSGRHPYGVHVRIKHPGGWKTIYGHLNQVLVHAGQSVVAGEVIGLADQTGNSVGHHVHLTLKKEGASAKGDTSYPNDIVDPTPYLMFPADRTLIEPLAERDQWTYGHCLVGLQARLDEPMTSADWEVVRAARIQALRLTNRSTLADAEQALQNNPDMFLLVSLIEDLRNRRVRPEDFARDMEDTVREFYARGVRYFEVFHDPNLASSGLGTSWHSGREFAQWFLDVVGWLRGVAPDARFGWPGLSPGNDAGMRMDHQEFLKSAGELVRQADWIGCHCYWEDGETIFSSSAAMGYRHYREEWPDKPIFITEFSNVSPFVSPEEKGMEYVRFYRHLLEEPGIGAAFAACVSAPVHYEYEVWRREDGTATGFSAPVGARDF